jgi:hypothetical protein
MMPARLGLHTLPGHVAVRQAYALAGQAIQVRRRDVLGALETNIGIAEIVGDDDHRVRRR